MPKDSYKPMNKKMKLPANNTKPTLVTNDHCFRRSLLSLAVLSCIAPMSVYAQEEGASNLEELVVTGQRTSMENAIEMKKDGNTIADSVVLDEVSKVPSTSLFEILQRVPGVTTNRIRAGNEGSPDGFSFEGSGIQIRGLRGTKALLNGREVYSANGGSGLSYSDIGPELLKTVTTYKAGRADLIEGGIGGTINLETAMPFDYDGTKIGAAVSASYGDFAEKTTPAGSILGSTRLDTPIGELGVLVDLAYSKIESHDSFVRIQPYYKSPYRESLENTDENPIIPRQDADVKYVPGGWQAGSDQFQRTRKGFYSALQLQATDQLELFQTSFVSRRESNRDTQFVYPSKDNWVIPMPGAVFDGDVFVSGRIRDTEGQGFAMGQKGTYTPSFSETKDFSQGFEYVSDRLTVKGVYQYVEAESLSNKWGLGLTSYNRGDSLYIDTNAKMGGIDIVDAPEPSGGNGETGTSNFPWLEQHNEASTHAFTLDFTYDLNHSFFKSVAGGVRHATRE